MSINPTDLVRLSCPNCAETCIHVEDVQVHPEPDLELSVRFWCEHCPVDPILHLENRSGTRVLMWHRTARSQSRPITE